MTTWSPLETLPAGWVGRGRTGGNKKKFHFALSPHVFMFFPDTLYFGELNEKIRLLYCLHIPPGYSLCEYDDELLSSSLMSAIY